MDIHENQNGERPPIVSQCWSSCSCIMFCPYSKILMPSFRYTQEIVTLNSLDSCAVQAVNPVRKSCWEIKSLHPDAASGSYKIKGPDGQPLSVQCDMTSQGGGWTLAGVAIFGQHGKSGTLAHLFRCIFVHSFDIFRFFDIGSNPPQVGTAKVS